MQKNQPIPFPQKNLRSWRILLNDLIIRARIGIYPNELRTSQDLRITLACDILAPRPKDQTSVDEVVCYDKIMTGVSHLVQSKQYFLLENLCEDIASYCLEDPRVMKVFVRIEKTAGLVHSARFGVELTRKQSSSLSSDEHEEF